MKRALMLSAVLGAAVLLGGCGGGDDEAGAASSSSTSAAVAKADPAACKTAYAEQFKAALVADDGDFDKLDETNVPDACVGLDQAALTRIVKEVTDEAVKAAMDGASD